MDEGDGHLLEVAGEEFAAAVALQWRAAMEEGQIGFGERVSDARTHGGNLCQLLIVVHEEGQVLERHVHIGITPELPVLLNRRLPPTKRILVDLILDHLCRIRHEDARRVDRSAHLALRTQERRDELGVDEGGLAVLEAGGHFARETEVGVLVDGAGDEAGDVGLGAEDLGERVGEGGGRLDGYEVPLADVVPASERGWKGR